MRTWLTSFLITGLLAGAAGAQCTYFRLSANLMKCEAVDAKAMNAANPYQDAQELPEFQEQAARALIQVSCTCDYSLSGSDPRCDVDESMEKSSVIGVDDASVTCRRGKSLCKDVCPSHLPS